jgi:two-component system, NtrC family, nitrogen regulation response regulator NtrX
VPEVGKNVAVWLLLQDKARHNGHTASSVRLRGLQMPNATVLIVDDEKNILLTLNQALQLEGYKTELAAGGQLALDVVGAKHVDAVLMDVKMPDMDGLAALSKIQKLRPDLPVIMMSGHGTIDTAVKATQLGARDFLEKPISRDRLLLALRNALTVSALVEELTTLKQEVGKFEMVGSSPAMQRVYALIQRAAPSEGRVLITGENGSGKELIARAIHLHSRRKSGPFVKLNCAAVPHELIESELFGHEKGAFTGAVTARRGKFELANDGTLFLDEVGDMPPAMQAKLLRVLQEGELERVGGAETIKVDVRVLAATNRNLEKEINAGRFREDLYFRLNVVQLHSPPLRERREDLKSLIDTVPARGLPAERAAGAEAVGGSARPARGVRLPGQRSRAAQPGRAAGDPLRGRGGDGRRGRGAASPPARGAGGARR